MFTTDYRKGKIMGYEVLKLENQLCFPLYASAKKVVGQYKPLLEAIDLTYTQYITMMVLWEQRCVGIKELGDYLYLDSGTLTPLLKRLEAKGFIRRERSQTDERSVIVTITNAGERLRDEAAKIPMKMQGCLPLTDEEAKILYVLLYKVLN
jgi:DNA-binding MarR family transcriptional regulator